MNSSNYSTNVKTNIQQANPFPETHLGREIHSTNGIKVEVSSHHNDDELSDISIFPEYQEFLDDIIEKGREESYTELNNA